MKSAVVAAVLTVCAAGPARADFMYSFDSLNNESSDFKFIVPSLLTAPVTIISDAQLFDVTTYLAGEALASILVAQPVGPLDPSIGLLYPGGGPLNSVFFAFGQDLDHVGTYASIVPPSDPATLTITEVTPAAIPEPTSVALLGTVLGAVALRYKQKLLKERRAA